MKVANTQIQIELVTMGSSSQVITVEQGATVKDALVAAGLSTENQKVFCGGVAAELHYELENGDILSVIKNKVDAGK